MRTKGSKNKKPSRYIQFIGKSFGRLTVTGVDPEPQRRSYFICKCSCGNISTPRADHVLCGRAVSCGCYRDEKTAMRMTTHGMTIGGKLIPEYYLYHGAKYRARRRNIPFTLTLGDITVPERCPVLGIPLHVTPDASGGRDGSPTLDRLIPALGYTKSNIAVISYRANRIKNDSNPTELRCVADWLEKVMKERRASENENSETAIQDRR